MRKPNYKVGWIIETKLAALTHFHSEITHEDTTGELLKEPAANKGFCKPAENLATLLKCRVLPAAFNLVFSPGNTGSKVF